MVKWLVLASALVALLLAFHLVHFTLTQDRFEKLEAAEWTEVIQRYCGLRFPAEARGLNVYGRTMMDLHFYAKVEMPGHSWEAVAQQIDAIVSDEIETEMVNGYPEWWKPENIKQEKRYKLNNVHVHAIMAEEDEGRVLYLEGRTI